MVMNSDLRFNIIFQTSDGQQHSYLFSPDAAVPATKALTLQAPFQYGAALYFLNLVIDGFSYPIPSVGFTSISVLWQWVQDNLASLGKWYLLENSLLLYVNAISGSLNISTLEGINGLSVLFPILQDEEYYMVVFNGMETSPETLYTKGNVLTWVQNNWGTYGTWVSDGVYLTFIPNNNNVNFLEMYAVAVGAFSDGFDKGFKI